MGVAAKKIGTYPDGVSRVEFEKSWVDLIDRVQIIDDKVSKKADEVVLTMVLAHRREIEQLQLEFLQLQKEIKTLQKQQKVLVEDKQKHMIEKKPIKKSLWNWFRK
ncbi:hypothetical protein [Pontibacillus yanchengensis]|uniref:Uncharacterized protein n=1 Tax=Pontibacillus yanchengensis Y32 TaxID=1385514 RepID=A0A0A2TF49_9BACI|nr:hypothetical protein [Pontibacillus yanchengensis]KGP73058.1 hypothetical protein N782_08005 [Pontibacillus yanchengensis Y32]